MTQSCQQVAPQFVGSVLYQEIAAELVKCGSPDSCQSRILIQFLFERKLISTNFKICGAEVCSRIVCVSNATEILQK